MEEPKRKTFDLTYSAQKLSIGFLKNGFSFTVPWEESYCDIDSSCLFNTLCEKKSTKDLISMVIHTGVRLHSLIYGRPFPSLESIFVRLPNGEIVRERFSTLSLVGLCPWRFDSRWGRKDIAEKVIALRKGDKHDLTIINALISARFEPNHFKRFLLAYPALEPFQSLLKNDEDKSANKGLAIKCLFRRFLIGDDTNPYLPPREKRAIIEKAAFLSQKVFSYIGETIVDERGFRAWVSNAEQVNDNPELQQWIEEFTKDKPGFSCSPLSLILSFAPHRLRCDLAHGNEPSSIHLAIVDDWSYKGVGLFTDFLLTELERQYLDYLEGKPAIAKKE